MEHKQATQVEISDERNKKEIQDIENPIDKIMKLKPKQYKLCNDKDYLLKYGLIAQQVQAEEELSEFVINDEEYIAIYIVMEFIIIK